MYFLFSNKYFLLYQKLSGASNIFWIAPLIVTSYKKTQLEDQSLSYWKITALYRIKILFFVYALKIMYNISNGSLTIKGGKPCQSLINIYYSLYF